MRIKGEPANSDFRGEWPLNDVCVFMLVCIFVCVRVCVCDLTVRNLLLNFECVVRICIVYQGFFMSCK